LAKPIVPIPIDYKNFDEKSLKFSSNSLNSLIEENNNFLNESDLNEKIDYMITYLNATNGVFYRIGVCIPSTCDEKDLENAVNKCEKYFRDIKIFFLTIYLFMSSFISDNKLDCRVRARMLYKSRRKKSRFVSNFVNVCEKSKFQRKKIYILCKQNIFFLFFGKNIFFRSVFITLSSLVIISTLAEILLNLFFENSKISRIRSFSTLFSVIKNTKKLFNNSSDRLIIVDFFRVLTIVWFFLQKNYLITATIGSIGLKRIINGLPSEIIQDKKYFWIRTPFTIDLFFMIW
jgi:hypothetical protein